MEGNILIAAGSEGAATARVVVSVLYMAICGIQDLISRRVSLKVCAAAGIAGLFFEAGDLAAGRCSFPGLLACLVPGLFLLLAASAAKGSAGKGDGICFLVLGLFLGAQTVWTVALAASLLAAVTGIVLIALHRAGRKTKLPFLSFGAAAWLGIVLLHLTGIEW